MIFGAISVLASAVVVMSCVGSPATMATSTSAAAGILARNAWTKSAAVLSLSGSALSSTLIVMPDTLTVGKAGPLRLPLLVTITSRPVASGSICVTSSCTAPPVLKSSRNDPSKPLCVKRIPSSVVASMTEFPSKRNVNSRGAMSRMLSKPGLTLGSTSKLKMPPAFGLMLISRGPKEVLTLRPPKARMELPKA